VKKEDKKNLDWFEDIQVSYVREKAKHNYKDKKCSSYKDVIGYSTSLAASIDRSFSWACSDEGQYFWSAIYDLCKYGKAIDDIDIKEGYSFKDKKDKIYHVLFLKKDKLIEDPFVNLIIEDDFTENCVVKYTLRNFKKEIKEGNFTKHEC